MLSPAQQLMKNINAYSYSHAKSQELYKSNKIIHKRLPLFAKPKQEEVSTKHSKLDLNEFLIKNPDDTFLIRVTGNSMIKAGINTGDILVVDRSIDTENGKIVVAAINGELLVKRLRYTDDGTELVSENDNFPPIKINEDDEFNVWGVVKSVIKSF